LEKADVAATLAGMGEYLEELPQPVREHLRLLVEPAGLAGVDDAVELLAKGWLEKRLAFEHHTADRGMGTVEFFGRDDAKGALVMTHSGSIVSIGPVLHGERDVAYASIGVRRDVPQMSTKQDCALAADVVLGESVVFDDGPVRSTSPVYEIAVFKAALASAKENAALVEITKLLTQRFVDINQEILHPDTRPG